MPRVSALAFAMSEMPRPFDNDDDAAAAEALGRLNQRLANARSRAEQDTAIAAIKHFLDQERSKRVSRRD